MDFGRLSAFPSSVLGVCATLIPSLAGAAERPNVVILVADDLDWADVSFHGEQIKTLNIEGLVIEGADLSRFYDCPVCSPTRAELMTGRYPIRYGLMRAVLPPRSHPTTPHEKHAYLNSRGHIGFAWQAAGARATVRDAFSIPVPSSMERT